jgi:hypothetical protein
MSLGSLGPQGKREFTTGELARAIYAHLRKEGDPLPKLKSWMYDRVGGLLRRLRTALAGPPAAAAAAPGCGGFGRINTGGMLAALRARGAKVDPSCGLRYLAHWSYFGLLCDQ